MATLAQTIRQTRALTAQAALKFRRQPFRSGAILVTCFVVLAAGCTAGPTLPAVDTRVLETRATAAVADGDLRAAATIYRQLAAATAGTVRSGYLINAASLEIDLGNPLSAAELIASARNGATPVQLAQSDIQLARIVRAEGRPAEALALVMPLTTSTDEAIRIAALEQIGLAQFALDRPVDALRSFSEREVWLNDIDAIRVNQRRVWQGLQETQSPTGLSGDATIDGWLALGPIARMFSDQEQRRALIEWRSTYRQHPAARILLTELLMDPEGAQGLPRQIAVLLPFGSGAREAARAIQDGFMAEHMRRKFSADTVAANSRQATTETQIRFYDTAIEGASAAYLRAELEGAEFIVGPLLRPEVEEILPQAGLVPTLTLNFTLDENDVTGNTYQFALAPEDEAIAAARRAISLGQRRAVVLIPSNDRGYRILNSFRSEYEALGGEILAFNGFDNAVQTYSQRITALINLDRSNQRQRRLAANLGTTLEFEPRRRQDIDMIFVAADDESGRMLLPQLEYFYAGDIPTYGISNIYNPASTRRGGDLNGIIFSDVPWLIAPNESILGIQRTISANWPLRSTALARFFALGIDAYSIVEVLHRDPFFTSIDGVTGKLSMDTTGRIRRSLPFAQIRGGVAQLLPDSLLDEPTEQAIESQPFEFAPDQERPLIDRQDARVFQ